MPKYFETLVFRIASIAVLSLSVHHTAAAEESPITVDLDVGVYTDYMFRGFNLYDGISFQPSIATSYALDENGSITASVWSHIPGENSENDNDDYTEIDYNLYYNRTIGDLSLSTGFMWYTYENSDLSSTAEVFLSLALDTLLTPTISVYHDFEEFDTQYYELGLSHRFDIAALGDGFNVSPFVNFGFASNSEKVYADDGFVQSTFGLAFEASLGDVLVSPSIHVTRESDDFAENEIWAGTHFSYSF
jgi:hypothetical protein